MAGDRAGSRRRRAPPDIGLHEHRPQSAATQPGRLATHLSRCVHRTDTARGPRGARHRAPESVAPHPNDRPIRRHSSCPAARPIRAVSLTPGAGHSQGSRGVSPKGRSRGDSMPSPGRDSAQRDVSPTLQRQGTSPTFGRPSCVPKGGPNPMSTDWLPLSDRRSMPGAREAHANRPMRCHFCHSRAAILDGPVRETPVSDSGSGPAPSDAGSTFLTCRLGCLLPTDPALLRPTPDLRR